MSMKTSLKQENKSYQSMEEEEYDTEINAS